MMESDYIKNKIDKTDSNYEYDIRADFEPEESNDWDADDEILEEL